VAKHQTKVYHYTTVKVIHLTLDNERGFRSYSSKQRLMFLFHVMDVIASAILLIEIGIPVVYICNMYHTFQDPNITLKHSMPISPLVLPVHLSIILITETKYFKPVSEYSINKYTKVNTYLMDLIYYYYYYYYYYYHHHHFLSQVFFLPWYFSS
jgi:hypothetical protein